MSLVNCRRWKVHDMDRAMACASVVLPTPGTSSMSRCPQASRHTSERLTASGFPRNAEPSMVSSSLSLASGASTVSRVGIIAILLNDGWGRPFAYPGCYEKASQKVKGQESKVFRVGKRARQAGIGVVEHCIRARRTFDL